MSKKKRLQIQRNAAVFKPPKAEEDMTLFYFAVYIKDDEIERVEQVSDFPFDTTEANGSLLTFPGGGFAIHITWFPFKPEPRSELRYKGFLEIMHDVGKRDPILKKRLESGSFGFGHPEDAKVSWRPPKGDD